VNRQRHRLRVRFTKTGKIRFVSHRDVARLFERALRILRLPVAYSEGFSPRPKLSFGLALSVGHESDAEYLDVEVTELPDIENLADRLTAALPDGLTVETVIELPPGSVSLQQAITSCTWRIEILGSPPATVTAAVAEALAARELTIERVRKGKTAVADVRPAIVELRVVGPTDGGTEIEAELSTESTSLRPSELVEVLRRLTGDDGLGEGRVRRTHQWIIVDGIRSEPVSAPDPSTRRSLQPELRRAS
jgi:radical SAM-linked protein